MLISGKITGTGSYLPERVVKNDEFKNYVDTNDEWITTRTGIRERRLGTGMENWEMGYNAAKKALESSGTDPETIDYVIGTTVTPDYFYPGLGNIVQWKLGASNASSFDIAAACSGFIVGINTALQYIKSGMAKKVLVVSADAISKTIDFTDRSTCVLFGDGAGAVMLEACETGGVLNTFTKTEPDPEGHLSCRALPPRNPFIKEGHAPIFKGLTGTYLRMDGRATYKFAVRALKTGVEKVLEGTGLILDDIKYIIPHQANLRIIDTVTAHLGINPEKMYVNIDKHANTSSATMPIALDEMSHKGMLKPHDKVICVGFGAGLTYGSVLLEW